MISYPFSVKLVELHRQDLVAVAQAGHLQRLAKFERRRPRRRVVAHWLARFRRHGTVPARPPRPASELSLTRVDGV